MKNIIKSIQKIIVCLFVVCLAGCAGMTDADWEALGAAAEAIADATPSKNSSTKSSSSSFSKYSSNSQSSPSYSDPSAAANECVRINKGGGSYSGFTNICNFSISVIHCLDGGDLSAGDARFFSCHRSGGLWSKQTTAGNLGAGKTDRTHLGSGGMVRWYACKAPYSIRNARYEGGRMYAHCVR